MSGISVHYLVVEAGVYANMEAVRFESTVTDWAGSWIGASRDYANASGYASPVVVGQVMSANNDAFSVFWARADGGTHSWCARLASRRRHRAATSAGARRISRSM